MLLPEAATMQLDAPLAHYVEHGYARLGRVLSDEGLALLRERADELMQGRVTYPGLFFQLDATTGRYEDAPLGLGWQGPSTRYRKLEKLELESPPVDFKFTLADVWSRRLLIALLRRYELEPFRYRGQRTTTVMVKVSKRFVDETLWPQFLELERTLRGFLDEVTDRVISEAIHRNTAEVDEVAAPKALAARES